VVGITDYPTLGDPPPPALHASDKDAQAIVQWLVDPAGGGLDPTHVREIRTSMFPPGSGPAPARAETLKAFNWLHTIASENAKNGRRFKIGRRLYIYMSGHGFSPGEYQAALYPQ
jgi:hypothetical protein